jgi:uncharacterized damage-inducible protein DinB
MKRLLCCIAVLAILSPRPLHAQDAPPLSSDLVSAITSVEAKIVGLGEAMSAAQYDWRPGAGVRSVGEVLLHVAADNYFLPAVFGVAAPAATGINGSDYGAVQAYESRKLTRDATLTELRASFEHLRRAVASVPESRMNEPISVFGQNLTMRSYLLLTTTHLHEHLGQLIAYARSNGVAPPWSR